MTTPAATVTLTAEQLDLLDEVIASYAATAGVSSSARSAGLARRVALRTIAGELDRARTRLSLDEGIDTDPNAGSDRWQNDPNPSDDPSGEYDSSRPAAADATEPTSALLGGDPSGEYWQPTKPLERVIAWGRDESDACQASTPGCSIDHMADNGPCETW